MSFYDSVMSDTVGLAYRAYSGNVDPWTKQQIIDDAAAENIAAGADQAAAQLQAEADVTNTLKTFSLGGDDPTGADPSQTSSALRIPSTQAEKDALKSLANDNGEGCGITNLGGCIPEVPSWVKWTAAGVLVLAALYLLGPYVNLAASATGRARS